MPNPESLQQIANDAVEFSHGFTVYMRETEARYPTADLFQRIEERMWELIVEDFRRNSHLMRESKPFAPIYPRYIR